MTKPLRVVLVEHSHVQAAALVRMLEADRDIAVVATARDAEGAARAVAQQRPDVVTMDLEIPGGGQRAIESIMRETPTPILIVTGAGAARQAAPTVQALSAGAVEALPKPHVRDEQAAVELRRQVRRVGRIPVIRRLRQPTGGASGPLDANRRTSDALLAVAASTGGPAALATLFRPLSGTPARILLVQHIHPAFALGFGEWLAATAGMQVLVASDGDRLQRGCIHIAPPEHHLRLGPRERLAIAAGPRSLHCPSANVLFHSVAQHAGARAVGVLLTGMGDDGAEGLLAMRQAGARTFAQDEATSAVFGMPRAAQQLGAVEAMLPVEQLAPAVREALRHGR